MKFSQYKKLKGIERIKTGAFISMYGSAILLKNYIGYQLSNQDMYNFCKKYLKLTDDNSGYRGKMFYITFELLNEVMPFILIEHKKNEYFS